MSPEQALSQKKCGILLHITALPSNYGIGDLGPEAHTFIDKLVESKQRLWQILPLSPTQGIMGHSPYSSCSAHALNPILISPEHMVEDGFLDASDLPPFPEQSSKADFDYAEQLRKDLLAKAFDRGLNKKQQDSFQRFCEEQHLWLHDFALFRTLEESYPNLCWNEWPEKLKNREPDALEAYAKTHDKVLQLKKFVQYVAHHQWMKLKNVANEKGIQLFGDLPLYVSYHSVDVWSDRSAFKLDETGASTHVAGVPPDAFCPEGQRWGNPVYDWKQQEDNQFDFWVRRLGRNFELFDLVRIDHFRGLAAYWEIPASEPTAMVGEWVDAPGQALIKTLKDHFPNFAVVAEDLGMIDEPVKALMRDHQLAGMKVLIFAFHHEGDDNPYLPFSIGSDSIVYTGTHDNNTTLGWFQDEMSDNELRYYCKYALSKNVEEHELHAIDRGKLAETVHFDLINMALHTKAEWVIIPIQDILGLGSEARFNVPGTATGNWHWKLLPEQLHQQYDEQFKKLLKTETTPLIKGKHVPST